MLMWRHAIRSAAFFFSALAKYKQLSQTLSEKRIFESKQHSLIFSTELETTPATDMIPTTQIFSIDHVLYFSNSKISKI